MAEYTEKEIISAIRTGADSSVFLYLYEKVFPKVRAYILKNSGDLDESKDIFQDALLVFCTKVKADTYVHQTEIDGFIYAVSRNLWINRLKIKNRKSVTPIDDLPILDDNDTDQLVKFKERDKTIETLFEQLGERCKELLLNTIYNKLSMTEICQKMGFANENVAKTKNYKCKQRLIGLAENNKAELIELLR